MKGWRSPNDGPRDPLIFPVVSLKVSGAWNNDVRKLQGLLGPKFYANAPLHPLDRTLANISSGPGKCIDLR